jgi:hypothetical protein
MLKRGCSKKMSDRRDLFAYPFKVLRDIFTNPPFMPEPEFTRFDLNALRGKKTASSNHSKLARANRKRIGIPVLLLALVLIVLALIVLG